MKTSSSPARSMWPSVRSPGTTSCRSPAGSVTSTSFTAAPSPPSNQWRSPGATPYSSSRMPRTHTAAVMWYFGTPTRLPTRSRGSWIPAPSRTQIAECRNANDGNTGMATRGSPRARRMV